MYEIYGHFCVRLKETGWTSERREKEPEINLQQPINFQTHTVYMISTYIHKRHTSLSKPVQKASVFLWPKNSAVTVLLSTHTYTTAYTPLRHHFITISRRWLLTLRAPCPVDRVAYGRIISFPAVHCMCTCVWVCLSYFLKASLSSLAHFARSGSYCSLCKVANVFARSSSFFALFQSNPWLAFEIYRIATSKVSQKAAPIFGFASLISDRVAAEHRGTVIRGLARKLRVR